MESKFLEFCGLRQTPGGLLCLLHSPLALGAPCVCFNSPRGFGGEGHRMMGILEAAVMFSKGREATLLPRVLSNVPAAGKEGSAQLGA